MIKLKTLILENNKPILSKMEEQYAFNLILTKLLPDIVNFYNDFVSNKKNKNMKKKFYYTTLKEMAHNIKKIDRTSDSVEYDCILRHGHVGFKIQKEIDPITGENEIMIGYLSPTDIGWHHGSGYTWYDSYNLIDK